MAVLEMQCSQWLSFRTSIVRQLIAMYTALVAMQAWITVQTVIYSHRLMSMIAFMMVLSYSSARIVRTSITYDTA
jgi:hypothetical protein